MSVTWGRVLIGLAVAVCLLGVGVLEVLSERIPSDRVSTPPRPATERWEPSLEAGEAPGVQAGEKEMSTTPSGSLTASVQQGRLTLVEVNEKVTEERGVGSLAR